MDGHLKIADAAFPPLAAGDLRQYVYCPRVVYYRYCVPVRPPPTYKMIEGKLQHERVEDLEHRRTLRAYGLADGERVFHVPLTSDRLGLSGILDMVVVRRHEVIPVEFKHTDITPARRKPRPPSPTIAWLAARNAGEAAAGPDEPEEQGEPKGSDLRVALHHKYQLAAYAMLAEERWQRPARRCFVYFVPARRPAEVAITTGVRDYTRRLLRDMRRMIVAQRIPAATPHAGRCRECEYRRFCNDVD